MKKVIVSILAIIFVVQIFAKNEKNIEYLNLETFKNEIFDYENNTEWSFDGELPVIIDFYADWCGPCKRLAPIMEELAIEYKGKVKIYKIDTDDQKQLAGMFGIQSIPSILFIPKEGQPQMLNGALPKETFVQQIKEVLKVK